MNVNSAGVCIFENLKVLETYTPLFALPGAAHYLGLNIVCRAASVVDNIEYLVGNEWFL